MDVSDIEPRLEQTEGLLELAHLSATTTPDGAEDDSWFFESEERIATQLDEEAEQYEQVLQLSMSPHPPELPVIEGNAEREAVTLSSPRATMAEYRVSIWILTGHHELSDTVVLSELFRLGRAPSAQPRLTPMSRPKAWPQKKAKTEPPNAPESAAVGHMPFRTRSTPDFKGRVVEAEAVAVMTLTPSSTMTAHRPIIFTSKKDLSSPREPQSWPHLSGLLVLGGTATAPRTL
jgi:hypothetical protein